MGEKVTESQASNLLALLRTDTSIDTKVNQINLVKSGIKQNNVPDTCVSILFEICRISMTSQHPTLANAGFSTLNHLLMRLSRQEPKHITREAARTLPLVAEKVGDQKEKYRQMAVQCLTAFWKAAPMDVERIVKINTMTGKNSRAKETGMQWLLQMHQEYSLQFRGFVPTLMELLEDADGMVRDCARNTVIELFQNAPNAAKADLKKQIKIFNVRPTIVAAITSHLGPVAPVETDGVPQEQSAVLTTRNHLADSTSSQTPHARPATPVTEYKFEHVEPSYVNTHRELDEIFRNMHPFFDGKESEQNWLKREQSCTKLRKLNAGNAPSDFHDVWVTGIKGLIDGILKAINSLRTSLSKEGCSVIQEIIRTIGPGLDSMVDILLQNLIKLCGGTKKISSQAGDMTVDIIISKVSYNVRILQHIWLACQDKNVQPRTYAAGWLKTLLKKESHHKNHVEHTGGLDIIEKCIKKGLADANPGVREKMRGTFWMFAQIWPARSDTIAATLDATQLKLLEADQSNPNSQKKVNPAAARPGPGLSKNTTSKPSLRETMLAQKKATLATKNLPARPGSAMSSFSPVRTASTSSMSSAVPNTADVTSKAPVSRTRTETSGSSSHGGLSVAPMRPTKFRPRPEIARPATAGPYSVRKPVHVPTDAPEAPITSPNRKGIVPNSTSSSPKKVIVRPNTSHSSHTSQSFHTSPSKDKHVVSRSPVSPRESPKSLTTQTSSPSKGDEDFTMVIPRGLSTESKPITDLKNLNRDVITPAKSLKVYEDPFSDNDDQSTPRPMFTVPVLGEVPINEDAINLTKADGIAGFETTSPEKSKQNSRLLDSGITKVKSKSLDVHGFRKLQGLIKENKSFWSNGRFDTLLLGLFEYLEAPLLSLTPEKVQDVKAQILTTIKLLLKKDYDAFKPHVPEGLRSLLETRSCYDARAHIVSGLELLADELAVLANPKEAIDCIIAVLAGGEGTPESRRRLSLGLHVIKRLLDSTKPFVPSDKEMDNIGKLALRCLESGDSGVRMEAVQLCVALHENVGEKRFWEVMSSVRDDPKSLIMYYVVKRQRELGLS